MLTKPFFFTTKISSQNTISHRIVSRIRRIIGYRSKQRICNQNCSNSILAKAYNTKNIKCGVALIFNHFQFNTSEMLRTRLGTEKDCDKLQTVLKKIGFDVRIFNDLTYRMLMDVLKNVAQENHTDNDCFAVFVLSYGNNNDVVYANDMPYFVNEILDNFTENNCVSLIAKPKLFFINACRGYLFDSGVIEDMVPFVRTTDHTSTQVFEAPIPERTASYFIPKEGDLLVMHSTYEDHCSWLDSEKGSWFIQALCTELLHNWQTQDLLTILTRVSGRVANEYQTNNAQDYHLAGMKQMPCLTFTLTKKIYFTYKLELE